MPVSSTAPCSTAPPNPTMGKTPTPPIPPTPSPQPPPPPTPQSPRHTPPSHLDTATVLLTFLKFNPCRFLVFCDTFFRIHLTISDTSGAWPSTMYHCPGRVPLGGSQAPRSPDETATQHPPLHTRVALHTNCI